VRESASRGLRPTRCRPVMPSRPAAIPAACRVFAPAGSDSDASECARSWPGFGFRDIAPLPCRRGRRGSQAKTDPRHQPTRQRSQAPIADSDRLGAGRMTQCKKRRSSILAYAVRRQSCSRRHQRVELLVESAHTTIRQRSSHARSELFGAADKTVGRSRSDCFA
jgi:hypothetical protein